MSEYIKRDVLVQAFMDELLDEMPYSLKRELAEKMVDNIPKVDVVEVRHGRWEKKDDPYGFFEKIPVCSECGCTTELRKQYAYCPYCGAKMDGGGDDEL